MSSNRADDDDDMPSKAVVNSPDGDESISVRDVTPIQAKDSNRSQPSPRWRLARVQPGWDLRFNVNVATERTAR
jgi:hypothetical protein